MKKLILVGVCCLVFIVGIIVINNKDDVKEDVGPVVNYATLYIKELHEMDFVEEGKDYYLYSLSYSGSDDLDQYTVEFPDVVSQPNVNFIEESPEVMAELDQLFSSYVERKETSYYQHYIVVTDSGLSINRPESFTLKGEKNVNVSIGVVGYI